MRHGRCLPCLAAAVTLLFRALSASAQAAAGNAVESPAATPGPAGLWQRPNLLGDLGGLRPVLDGYGITLKLSETGEVLGNVTGGTRRGFAYAGLSTVSLELDTAKALHWRDGTFFASALQIHGRDLNTDNLSLLQTVSNIDASRATRLWELWFQQKVPGFDADVKLGQQSIDQEFLVNDDGGVFLNAMMGFPALPSNDLYGGAPVYPLSSLGIRVRAKPADGLTLLAGVFDDNPPGGPFFDDSQLRGAEASGARFNLGTGALLIGEVQYALAHPPFADPQADLPGTYKLGAWIDTGRFPDQRFDAGGLSLADPASNGVRRFRRGNFSLYGIADQQVWHSAGGHRTLAVFVRAMGAPEDRNLVDWSLNAGISLKAPLPGRDDDTFGIGYGWAHVSGHAAALDRDTRLFTGTPSPIRSAEQAIEITYQYQAAPWWLVQPDLQYAIKPAGGIVDPLNAPRRIGDELVLGVRTTLTF